MSSGGMGVVSFLRPCSRGRGSTTDSWNTVHLTFSVHGGVVSDPSYLVAKRRTVTRAGNKKEEASGTWKVKKIHGNGRE